MINYESVRFKNRKDVEELLDKMRTLADNYGVVLMDDYKELCDIKSDYMDTKYGWFKHMIEATVIRRDYYGYFIDLPKPVLIEYSKNDTHEDYSPTNPYPDILNITIYTNELENPAEILADIFKHIPDIKERMINITIM